MTEVISVRFRGGCKNYYFDPCGHQVKMGDQVIVETAQGPEFATCTEGNHEVEDSAIVKTLSPMLRLATDSDRRTVEQNKKRESEAFDICEKKIAAHGLEMKLVNVSASFDGSKIVFYFTADGRVDFRELVRDLAGVFRARIELRQIGVRDEAKMIGGLGICGRPFCCSQFLDGFLPVSIKMAKTQNLSLNPAKISGTCGRLMCCLKYEQNVYEDASKRMPKVESFVQTPDGPGNVKSVDLLRETVKVSLDSAPEPLKCYHNCEICILRNGKGSREGITIPERPARYVEERDEEEGLEAPTLTTPFYMDARLEDAPTREKIGAPGSGESKPRRRHRGGRRRGGKSGEGAEQSKAEAKRPEQKESKPRPPRQESKPTQPKPAEGQSAAPGGEGETKRRRRPHHRGGRRRNKNGGEGGSGGGQGGNAGDGNGSQGNAGNNGGTGGYSFQQAEEIAQARAERAEKAALSSYFKQQGMSEEEINQAIKDFKANREKQRPTVDAITRERDDALAELAQMKNSQTLAQKGVRAEDTDYVMFKIAALMKEDSKLDFEKAATKFLKENPRFTTSGSGSYRVKTGTESSGAGSSGNQNSNDFINAAIRRKAGRN